jgi:DNA-binding transcriptional MerR regulator
MVDHAAGARVAGDGFTIGEVLNQLKHDFEDISISKIRFLESEGLISPDRTESGYRKFSDDDVNRLRFILTAQRDHYLPLKVIREQLARVDSGTLDEPEGNGQAGVLPGMEAPSALDAWRQAEAAHAENGRADEPLLDPRPTTVQLSLVQFCEATGMKASEVRALKDFGIISGRGNDAALLDGDDLNAAKAARELIAMGLEPRHLRMYAQFVDRELALFSQLITPLMRQRGPEARRRAARQLEELGSQTSRMKRALLAKALRGYVQGG